MTQYEVIIMTPSLWAWNQGTDGATKNPSPTSVAPKYLAGRHRIYAESIATILGHGSYRGRTLNTRDDVGALHTEIEDGHKCFFLPWGTVSDDWLVKKLRLNDNNCYGGIVTTAHQGSKVVMHDLVRPNASRPQGWSEAFAKAASQLTLPGYSVFSVEDMDAAVGKLLEKYHTVRIKMGSGRSGSDQFIVGNKLEYEKKKKQIKESELASNGAVVEVNLESVTTFAVSFENVGAVKIAFVSVDKVIPDIDGKPSYSYVGTDKGVVVRGGIKNLRLKESGIPSAQWDALQQAILYAEKFDDAVHEHLPGTKVSRRFYQTLTGLDGAGNTVSGVLEQSYRLGGDTAIVLAAIEELVRRPQLVQLTYAQTLHARTIPDNVRVWSERPGNNQFSQGPNYCVSLEVPHV